MFDVACSEGLSENTTENSSDYDAYDKAYII